MLVKLFVNLQNMMLIVCVAAINSTLWWCSIQIARLGLLSSGVKKTSLHLNVCVSFLIKFLGVAHQQCCRQRTQTMLARLYKPFLWRALRVANAHVRANAVTLMLDAFPLLEPQACRQDMDQQLQQQFDLIKVGLLGRILCWPVCLRERLCCVCV